MAQIDEIKLMLDPLPNPLSEGLIICDSTSCVLTANGAVYGMFDMSEDA